MDRQKSLMLLRRSLVIVLPLVALVCIVGLTVDTDAALIDKEPPNQYNTFGTAYVLQPIELGSRLEIRKDGGGDSDFLKLNFLNLNDMVTVEVNQTEPTTAVEYWVSDPNKFPIYYYWFDGSGADPHFFYSFTVTVSGSWYIHTGQGLGDTFINLTINRMSIPPPAEKDDNNKPGDKVLLIGGQTHRENAGNPWDPSDFFYINIQPTLLINKYLTIDFAFETDLEAQWELYNTAGILRPSEVYTSDTIRFGSTLLEYYRITDPGDYIVRVWVKDGFGQYNLTLSILSYPNDEDNSIDEATTVDDDDVLSSDVNLSFDREDYYVIYLDKGTPLWVRLTPINGPTDLYIYDSDELQKAASRRSDLSVDFITPMMWTPEDDGLFYIVVKAVYEAPDWENPPTVNYTLEVWINWAPNVKPGLDPKLKNYHIMEDTTDTDYDVTAIFEDKDGDPLGYELDMSYNDTLISIELMVDNHLRMVPVANASGFKISILLNATDPRGLKVNYTVNVFVDPVNDAPYVYEPDIPEVIEMGEDLVKSGVNVTMAFRDVDDDYFTWTFTWTSATNVGVELDPETWLATLTPLTVDWFGTEYFNVTCHDSGDLTASITLMVVVKQINDPPKIIEFIPPMDIEEEKLYCIELAGSTPKFIDPEGGALRYEIENNQSIEAYIANDTQLCVKGLKDFVGTVRGMILRAVDDVGAKSQNMTLFFEVINVDDPPKVTVLISTGTVKEGSSITFSQDTYYTVSDPDSELFDLEFVWYVNDVQVPPNQISDRYNYEYFAPQTAEKDRTVVVRLEVIDGDLPPVPVEWTISVTNLNAAPAAPTMGPDEPEKKQWKEGETIRFSANSSDIDGDVLTYEWFLDLTRSVGTGPNLELKGVSPGSHKITVVVTDPSLAESSAEYDIKVLEEADGGGGGGMSTTTLLIIVGAIVAVVVIIGIVFFIMRAPSEEEMGIKRTYGEEEEAPPEVDEGEKEPEEPKKEEE